ncbi:hypothetical protein KP509_02G100800 [Ceratopteris richardii]|uniref:Myb-like domain-containing protein n=1 Tax=Ceratopteris richardii TaxID=49495 RepID=A0A8T2VG48_CERRI|nr:hypothetical protein KP509_02G100800 [Ceratopteris richardii]
MRAMALLTGLTENCFSGRERTMSVKAARGESAAAAGVADGVAGYVKKGRWSPQADKLLTKYIRKHGASAWSMVRMDYPQLKRITRSCRLGRTTRCQPSISHHVLSPEEMFTILRVPIRYGNQRSKTASMVVSRRTHNAIRYVVKMHVKTPRRRDIKFSLTLAATCMSPSLGVAAIYGLRSSSGGDESSSVPWRLIPDMEMLFLIFSLYSTYPASPLKLRDSRSTSAASYRQLPSVQIFSIRSLTSDLPLIKLSDISDEPCALQLIHSARFSIAYPLQSHDACQKFCSLPSRNSARCFTDLPSGVLHPHQQSSEFKVENTESGAEELPARSMPASCDLGLLWDAPYLDCLSTCDGATQGSSVINSVLTGDDDGEFNPFMVCSERNTDADCLDFLMGLIADKEPASCMDMDHRKQGFGDSTLHKLLMSLPGWESLPGLV